MLQRHLGRALRRQYRESYDSSVRSFHGTSRQEILPVIAVGAVLMIGRYSWKALNRMDDEWEDYQWQLQQYERQKRKDQADADAPITIGVDLGTIYLKLSTNTKSEQSDTSKAGVIPELVPTVQGDRYRFTGLLRDKDSDQIVVGRPALEKFFYQPAKDAEERIEEPVVLPYRELQKQTSDAQATDLLQQFVLPSIGEAMEKLSSALRDKNSSRNVRTVLTLPPVFYNQHMERIFHQNYHDASHHTITVPDPVAAIWGAQIMDLLPTPSTKEEIATTSTLVLDVGGLATSISLVRQDRVLGTAHLDHVGGETLVQQLVQRVLKETGDETFQKDPMSLALIETSARSSVLELANKTQSNLHIPFLFMGRKPDEPHFETTVSRKALEQAAQDHWTTSVVPNLMKDGELSSSMPPPTSASTLITSAVTKVLEESGELPNNIQHILLVGGGSRYELFERACEEGVFALMGPSPEKLVLPEPSVRAELTAIGAASLLPNYDYDHDKGLERIED